MLQYEDQLIFVAFIQSDDAIFFILFNLPQFSYGINQQLSEREP
jgi:hypothetical protein